MQWRPWTGETWMPLIAGWRLWVTPLAAGPGDANATVRRERLDSDTARMKGGQDMVAKLSF